MSYGAAVYAVLVFRCIPCDFFGDDRCAAGEFSGDDRCMAGAGPPARCLYKGVVGGGVPRPLHCSFAFLASEKSLSALFAFAFCCPRAFRLSACVSRLGCCRGGFLFRLRPNSRGPPFLDPIATFSALGLPAGVRVLRSACLPLPLHWSLKS